MNPVNKPLWWLSAQEPFLWFEVHTHRTFPCLAYLCNLTPMDSMANVNESPNEIVTLEDRIQTLTDLYNRLQGLRQIPTHLLKPPAPTDLPSPLSALRTEFLDIKSIREDTLSGKVQEALRVANESEKKDKSELSSNFRRENRKRR